MTEHKGLRPEAYEEIPGDEYVPYVPHESEMAEFTIKGLVLGSLFGIAFGAANAYLGLRVGLTISTSIPIAVMTVAVFAMLKPLMGRATILESNMAKTVGSASSSLASGIIFTIPALFLWGLHPDWVQISILAAIGGCLGVLFMVPLRRFLINEEHGKLPYPEGTASAEVLVAAEAGGTTAKNVFLGMAFALIYSFFWKALSLWSDTIRWRLPFIKKAEVSLEPSPALLGVGYILGFRIGTIMVLGAALSFLVIMPIIGTVLANLIFAPETSKIVEDMTLSEMRNKYIRYIGAGAVASAGIITLIRSIPTMIKSFQVGISRLGNAAGPEAQQRTDRDLGFGVVLLGAAICAVILVLVPFLFQHVEWWNYLVRIALAVLVVILAFFFVTVSARIVGLVGVTSNPTSGMVIGTLIVTSLLFLLFGWTDITGKATVLVMGTMVGVAASIAGDTSQDLKTGFLLGATPSKQQVGEIIGVLTTAFFVAGSLFLLESQYGFGEGGLAAPQANMMKLVVDGIIDQSIPWALVLIGVLITLVVELFRLPSLAFAVGVYLPLATMTPIFVGGLMRLIVEKRSAADKQLLRARRERGVLFGSGLVGGEGLMGVGIAGYAFFMGKPTPVLPEVLGVLDGWQDFAADSLRISVDLLLLSVLPVAVLVYLLWRAIHSGEKKKRDAAQITD